MTSFTLKTIYIENQYGPKLEVTLSTQFIKEQTCKWLLEELKSKLKQICSSEKLPEIDRIVALQTTDAQYAVDQWLTLPHKSANILENGTILKPFYKQSSNTKKNSTKISLDDFIIETKLGYGAFSNVYLVRKKDTGILYALKQVKKRELSPKIKKALRSERQAGIEIKSYHIVSLHHCFQTENHCYFVQEFVPCGDLHGIALSTSLSEKCVRFYVAEVLLGLHAIHSANFIYRDLKPENILLDIDGHIRIADFGLSKKVKHLSDLNSSVCGTHEITAPEILNKKGHNFLVDYYNLGTFAYELVARKPPIFIEKERILDKRCSDKLDRMSDEFKNFVKRLLEPEPRERLGAKGGLMQICSHPWLKSIDFGLLENKKIKPPLLVHPSSITFKVSLPEGGDIEKNSEMSRGDNKRLSGFSFSEESSENEGKISMECEDSCTSDIQPLMVSKNYLTNENEREYSTVLNSTIENNESIENKLKAYQPLEEKPIATETTKKFTFGAD